MTTAPARPYDGVVGRLARLLVALAALVAGPASARPTDPRGAAFEVGGVAFALSDRGGETATLVAGPLLHLGVRTPIPRTRFAFGLTSRFGLAARAQGSAPTGSISLEGRATFGGFDVAPYVLAGGGVLFRSTLADTDSLGLVQKADLQLPVGVGLDLRVGDETMFGFALRYAFVATALSTTAGPIDLAVYLVFL